MAALTYRTITARKKVIDFESRWQVGIKLLLANRRIALDITAAELGSYNESMHYIISVFAWKKCTRRVPCLFKKGTRVIKQLLKKFDRCNWTSILTARTLRCVISTCSVLRKYVEALAKRPVKVQNAAPDLLWDVERDFFTSGTVQLVSRYGKCLSKLVDFA